MSNRANGWPALAVACLTLGTTVSIGFAQTRLHVWKGSSQPGNGNSWTTAFHELDDCLEFAAAQGDYPYDIWVAAGTYQVHVPASEPTPAAAFVLDGGVRLFGGFTGVLDEMDIGDRDVAANITILSGVVVSTATPEIAPCGDPDAGSCFEMNGTPGCDEAFCCVIVCDFDPQCCENTWDGLCAEFAGENCYTRRVESVVATSGDGGTDRQANGFRIVDGGTDVQGTRGGGVRIGDGAMEVVLGTVTGNIAYDGGGVAVHAYPGKTVTDASIWNSRITDNRYVYRGGGVYATAPYTIVNSEITLNRTGCDVGEDPEACAADVASALFDGAPAPSPGQGDPPPPNRTIVNTTVTLNRGTPAIQFELGGPLGAGLELHNSIVWGNLAGSNELPCPDDPLCFELSASSAVAARYSDVNTGPDAIPSGWTASINADPVFADPAAGDFRLLATSPCLNRGLDDLALPDLLDVNDDGNLLEKAPDLELLPRIECRVDMGAHERCQAVRSDLDDDCDVDGGDLGELLALFGGAGPTGDLDCNGVVDGGDLGLLLSDWGPVSAECCVGAVTAALAYGAGASAAMGEQGAIEEGAAMTPEMLAAALGFASTEAFIAWIAEQPFETIAAYMALLV
ncbi:MAG: hypothetical protein KDA22_10975 [Phycisphaerales bacterium]|nr:hypothetical protein [Phycisphaerales bacterium]